jgi:16S rRNA (uracil1498-N3)-methyltransferase
MRRDGRPVPRLFVDCPLGQDLSATLADSQRHYVARVMRLGQGDAVRLFNGRDGEWLAVFDGAGALCREALKPQPSGEGPWLMFAPPKRDRLRFLVEKATELGVGRLIPVTTERTEPPGAKPEKMREWAIEAAEQCGRCDVPACLEQRPLTAVLADWPVGRDLLLCDETGSGKPLVATDTACCGFLVGPEGGFSSRELEMLRARREVVPVSLGSYILRVETACLAALATWHLRSTGASVTHEPGGAPTS